MELALLLSILLLGVVFVLFVHEIGHLLSARYFGIKVRCLSVGFGPQLLSFGDRFGTRWQLRALPIGGSCILEFSDEQKSRGGGDRAALALLSRSAVIHAAGPVFNLLLAGLLVFVSMLCTTRNLYGDDVGSLGIVIVRLIAELSMATALFNLLPFLPLDGGRLCLMAIEAGRGYPMPSSSERRFSQFSVTALAAMTLVYLIWLVR
jgi:membrane-associated protease RseP (regulator of RpoE activity)